MTRTCGRYQCGTREKRAARADVDRLNQALGELTEQEQDAVTLEAARLMRQEREWRERQVRMTAAREPDSKAPQ